MFDPATDIYLDEMTFTPACPYTFTYEIGLKNGSAIDNLPSFITVDPLDDMHLIVDSQDPAEIATYTLVIKGTLNNSPATNSKDEFNVMVVKNCEMDSVEIVTGITNPSVYYIGETTL